MLIPVADSTDLGTYLGTDNIDADRATMLLNLAQQLCEVITGSPAPEESKPVILSAATRAYVNPDGVTQEGAGPFQISRPSAGVYLTRSERANLRRLVGSGGAFSVDLAGINGAGDATDYPDVRFPDATLSSDDTL